jgi:hypothetical protein
VIHQDSLEIQPEFALNHSTKDGTNKDDKEWQVSLEPHDHVLY